MRNYSTIGSSGASSSWARPRGWRTLTSVGLVARLLACTLPAMALLAVPARAQVGPVAPSGVTQPYVPFGLDNFNILGVSNGAPSPSFNVPFPKVYVVASIDLYHWNYGQGAPPAYIGILDGRGNKTWWKASDGASGAQTDWVVYNPQDLYGGPFLMAWGNGPYRVLSSDQLTSSNTWSGNSLSQGGFFKIHVY